MTSVSRFLIVILLASLLSITSASSQSFGENKDKTGGGLFVILTLIVGVIIQAFFDNGHREILPYTTIMLLFGGILGILNEEGECLGQSTSCQLHGKQSCTLHHQCDWNRSFDLVDYHIFHHVIYQVFALAGPGVLIASSLIATFSKLAFDYQWNWNTAFMFGSILSATDPVAVVAILHDLGAPRKLSIVIEAESLFNDGTALVCFSVFVKLLIEEQSNTTIFSQIPFFLQLALGGACLGYLSGRIMVFCLHHIRHSVQQAIVTLIFAYSTHILAEQIEVSGVIATVCLGLVYATMGRTKLTDAEKMNEFWEMLEWIANTIIFSIAGMIMFQSIFSQSEYITLRDFLLLLALYAATNIIRAITHLVLLPILCTGYGTTREELAMMSWSGLRGAVGLILGLMVFRRPNGEYKGLLSSGMSLEEIEKMKAEILFHVAGISVLTLLINGTTVPYLAKALGLSKQSSASKFTYNVWSMHVTEENEEELTRMRHHKFYRHANWNVVLQYLPVLNEEVLEKRKEKLDQNLYKNIKNGHLKMLNSKYRNERLPTVLQDMAKFPVQWVLFTSKKQRRQFIRTHWELVIEARKRALDIMQAHYWSQFYDGFVGGEALKLVIQSKNMAMDDVTEYEHPPHDNSRLDKCEINDWHYLEPHMIVGKFARKSHDEVIHQLGVQEKESLESLTSAADEDTTNQRSQLAIKMRVAAKDLDHICQVKLHHIAQEAYSKVGDHLDLKHLQIYIEKAFPTFELGNYEDYIKVLLSTILFESNLKSRLNSKSLKTEDQKQSIGSDQQQKLQLFDHEAYLLLSDYMHHDHHPVLLGLVKAELESARDKANDLWNDYIVSSLGTLRTISTQHVIRHLIKDVGNQVNRIYHEGQIDHAEMELMESAVHECHRRLRNKPPTSGAPKKKELLRSVPFMHYLEESHSEYFDNLLSKMTEEHFDRGSALLKQGDPVSGCFLITCGTARVMYHSETTPHDARTLIHEKGEEQKKKQKKRRGFIGSYPSEVKNVKNHKFSNEIPDSNLTDIQVVISDKDGLSPRTLKVVTPKRSKLSPRRSNIEKEGGRKGSMYNLSLPEIEERYGTSMLQLGPGQIAGSLCVITHEHIFASIIANTYCIAYFIPASEIWKMFRVVSGSIEAECRDTVTNGHHRRSHNRLSHRLVKATKLVRTLSQFALKSMNKAVESISGSSSVVAMNKKGEETTRGQIMKGKVIAREAQARRMLHTGNTTTEINEQRLHSPNNTRHQISRTYSNPMIISSPSPPGSPTSELPRSPRSRSPGSPTSELPRSPRSRSPKFRFNNVSTTEKVIEVKKSGSANRALNEQSVLNGEDTDDSIMSLENVHHSEKEDQILVVEEAFCKEAAVMASIILPHIRDHFPGQSYDRLRETFALSELRCPTPGIKYRLHTAFLLITGNLVSENGYSHSPLSLRQKKVSHSIVQFHSPRNCPNWRLGLPWDCIFGFDEHGEHPRILQLRYSKGFRTMPGVVPMGGIMNTSMNRSPPSQLEKHLKNFSCTFSSGI